MDQVFLLSFEVFCPICKERYRYRIPMDEYEYERFQGDISENGFSTFSFDHGDHVLEVSINADEQVVAAKASPWRFKRRDVSSAWKRVQPFFPVPNVSAKVLFLNRRKRTYCDANWGDESQSFLPLVESGRSARYVVDGVEYWVFVSGENAMIVKRSGGWSEDLFNHLASMFSSLGLVDVPSDFALQKVILSVLEASADDPYLALDAARIIEDLGKRVEIDLDLITLSPVPFGGDLIDILASVGREAPVDALIFSASGIRDMVKLLKSYRLLKNLNLIRVMERTGSR
nr:hypothetical protein [Candidatus Bathyarchaeota archaeon]